MWPRAADTVLAIAIFLAIAFTSFEGPNEDFVIRRLGDLPVGAYLIFAIASGALIWRRRQPLAVLWVVLVALVLSTTFGYPNDFFGLPVALYSVGRYTATDRRSYLGVGAAITVGVVNEFIYAPPVADVGAAFVVLFAVWYVGRQIRARGDYLRLLQERATHRDREQAAAARRAVVEERSRIARELHDIVAHRVTLMTVQAGAAKTVAVDNPKGALKAMEAVEKAGRQALGELRHLLGVLRPEAEPDQLGPQPGIADVPRLVEHLGEAGLEVSLTINDLPADRPAPVDLSAYRIVQEALTNVLKHAEPGVQTEVRLSTDDKGLAIEVTDNGHRATTVPGSGHGIVGMRARARCCWVEASTPGHGGAVVFGSLPICLWEASRGEHSRRCR